MRRIAGACVTLGLLGAYAQQSAHLPLNPAVAEFARFLTEHHAQLNESLPASADSQAKGITVEYPREGSLFPVDMVAPLFQWRDAHAGSKIWRVEVKFGERGPKIREWSVGELMKVGPVDDALTGFVPPTLTPEQAASHTWRPDAKTWEQIKKHSQKQPAVIRFEGYSNKDDRQPVSSGQVTLATSPDPVGAPIMYRDVPLIPPPPESEERGVIKPLPDSVLPKIKWQLRWVNDTESKVVMTGLPTCANCHSPSRDGSTLGIDVDGPQNDKGLYALIPIKPVSAISNDYVIHWSAYSDEHAQKRFGFMSQVSPDGQFVVTGIDVPHAHGTRVVDRLYNGFYRNYGFGQVFFPTRGVLGWYSRESKTLQPLPGADDPNYVQTSAFWSPDGKYLVFSRARAKDPYAPGQIQATYANDPNETQIQYDLYRIQFNGGKGGTPERIVGASENGMSNNFPKVSPDGKWIVFVECKNGLLMRPDSKLAIVPFEGGTARPLASNLAVMNSWHTFSPNGHWLAFSSKTPSLYTELYLTHIDADGNASPAILVENATAANRAVNIPEFVNVKPGGFERLDHPATDFYQLFDAAAQFSDKKNYDAAVPAWKQAVALDPDDPRAHNNLGIALAGSGKMGDAVAEYQKSLALNGNSSQTENNLGSALAEEGNLEGARQHFENALRINPDNASAEVNLGNALSAEGGHTQDAIALLTKGLETLPDSPDGQNGLGIALAHAGNLEEATTHLQKAVTLAPRDAGYRSNLGRVLAAQSKFSESLPQFAEAARLSGGQDPAVLQMLAAMQSETGQYAEAATTAQAALKLAQQQQNLPLAASLEANLARYQAQAAAGQPQ
ncbi:MAG TPA: tetratricopeptide repeat protein [Acidobacteriaceae bacterium]|jgi:Flp pilus assembly protein TadD|nr:tetratricopeptide repeat protein [Acidobacteriaceae bacterium]